MKNRKKILKTVLIVILCLSIAGTATAFGINAYVKNTSAGQMLTAEEAAKLTDVDCILVLGCRVYEDGTPSPMLQDRLTMGIELYELGAAPKLLMSGDHSREDYNEVGAMKEYAIGEDVPSEDIFMDHAGLSTYESVYRAKEIFGADKIIIVTQGYHLYRALYIAEKLGMEAYGVASDYHTYAGQAARNQREILARIKDFTITLVKPEPTFLGEAIALDGNGNVTND